MNEQYFIYGLVGIILLFIIIKLLKWPMKIILNGIIGLISLYIVNIIGANLNIIGLNFNFSLPVNPITSLIAGVLGVPGIIAIAIIVFFM